MDLYEVCDGFVVLTPNFKDKDFTHICISDDLRCIEDIKVSVGTGIFEQKDYKYMTYLSHFDVKESNFTYRTTNADSKSDHLRYDILEWYYDIDSRCLICFDVNNPDIVYKAKCITKFRQWADNHPGPYKTLRIIIPDMDNPFSDVEYAYWDGWVMASDPGQIRLILPIDKVEEFKIIAHNRGYDL